MLHQCKHRTSYKQNIIFNSKSKKQMLVLYDKYNFLYISHYVYRYIPYHIYAGVCFKCMCKLLKKLAHTSHAHTQTQTHIHTHTHTHTYTHTHIHSYTHTHKHSHTHTQHAHIHTHKICRVASVIIYTSSQLPMCDLNTLIPSLII